MFSKFGKLELAMFIINCCMVWFVLTFNWLGAIEFSIELGFECAFSLELLLEGKFAVLDDSIERELVSICRLGWDDATFFHFEDEFHRMGLSTLGEGSLENVISNWQLNFLNLRCWLGLRLSFSWGLLLLFRWLLSWLLSRYLSLGSGLHLLLSLSSWFRLCDTGISANFSPLSNYLKLFRIFSNMLEEIIFQLMKHVV